MTTQLQLGDIAVDIVQKEIKNLHLSVHPPTGRVRIAAPCRMSLDTIRVFAISKLAWIKRQQTGFREQERESPREFLERESHYVWGHRRLMSIVEADGPSSVELTHNRIIVQVRPGSDVARREAVLERWYREQVKEAAAPLVAKWERRIGVKLDRLFVQRMKTRWGSCNASARSIRLNTDLAKKPSSCLEYIIVHEMTHLLERTHNERFMALMRQFLPKWQTSREILNSLPVRNEDWRYWDSAL